MKSKLKEAFAPAKRALLAPREQATSCKRKGTDSGYVSQTSSPGDRDEKCPTDPTNKFFPKRVLRYTKVQQFNVVPPPNVQARFTDLKIQYDEPLYYWLFSDGTQRSLVSVSLRYFGKDENDAKPYFFVMCCPGLSKKVKSFFKQKQVKDDFRPRPDDPQQISFKPLIHERAPIQLARPDTEIWGKIDGHGISSENLICGTLITTSAVDGKVAQYATLGGTIVVSSGPYSGLYGLTVEHFLQPAQPKIETSSDYQNNEEAEDSDADSIIADDLVVDVQDYHEITRSRSASPSPQRRTPEPSSPNKAKWETIGKAVDISPRLLSLSNKSCTNLDWALVELSSPKLQLTSNRGPRWNGNIRPLGNYAETDVSRPLGARVAVMAGVSGVCYGNLAETPASVVVGSSPRLVETYFLTLDLDRNLQTGDSGSWVFDIYSGEVYGQVVASDCLGGIYVVPLVAIFKEMEECLGTTSVTVCTTTFEPGTKIWVCQGPHDAPDRQPGCRACRVLQHSDPCPHRWAQCSESSETPQSFDYSSDFVQHLKSVHEIDESTLSQLDLDDWQVFQKQVPWSAQNLESTGIDSGYASLYTSPRRRDGLDVLTSLGWKDPSEGGLSRSKASSPPVRSRKRKYLPFPLDLLRETEEEKEDAMDSVEDVNPTRKAAPSTATATRPIRKRVRPTRYQ